MLPRVEIDAKVYRNSFLASEADNVVVVAHGHHSAYRSVAAASEIGISHALFPLRRLVRERKSNLVRLIVYNAGR